MSGFILFSPGCLPHSPGEPLFFQRHLKYLFCKAFSNHPLVPQAEWNGALNPVCSSVLASETCCIAYLFTCQFCFIGLTVLVSSVFVVSLFIFNCRLWCILYNCILNKCVLRECVLMSNLLSQSVGSPELY